MEDQQPNKPEAAPETALPSPDLVRLENIYGMLRRVSTTPDWVPSGKFLDQFAIDTILGILYVYDFDAASWFAATATDAHTRSLFSASGPLSYNNTTGVFTAVTQPQYAADTGSANAYAIAPGAPISSYAAGQAFLVTIANSSTGPSTLNVSGQGNKAVKKIDGTVAITKGDLVAGNTYLFTYDGTNFVVQVPVQRSCGELHIACNSGANTIVTGFMPRRIRFEWSYLSHSTGTIPPLGGSGVWINGTYAEAGNRNSASSGGAAAIEAWSDSSAIVTGKSASNDGDFTGAVGTLTDTGFDLTMTNSTSGNPSSVRISWEAES